MPQNNDCHIVPDGDQWAVKRISQVEPLSRHPRQDEAISAGRKAVHSAGGGELLVHGRDGQIRDKITIAPGNDPFPPAG